MRSQIKDKTKRRNGENKLRPESAVYSMPIKGWHGIILKSHSDPSYRTANKVQQSTMTICRNCFLWKLKDSITMQSQVGLPATWEILDRNVDMLEEILLTM